VWLNKFVTVVIYFVIKSFISSFAGTFHTATISPAVFYNITLINPTQYRKLQKPLLADSFGRLQSHQVKDAQILEMRF
jgi:hypothetical protein